jgi:apolipoprotein D and lipocalin family protein
MTIINNQKLRIMKTKRLIETATTASVMVLFFISCVHIPQGAVAVKNFDSQKYLGKWYEIARLDFKWEEGLDNTTAQYSLNDDGSIKVDNQGYDYLKKEWKQSIGKAKLLSDPTEGRLKVSFFGPFYSGYNILALDVDYKYALVVGDNLDYMWILSREKTISEDVKQQYLKIAQNLGYKTDNLIWVKHN